MKILQLKSMRTGKNKIGQALIELTIFGTFFLMLLSVLLSYGLKYNYQQKAEMTAFRRAEKIASDSNRGSGSAVVIQDVSTPDAADIFGVGSTAPIIASASVTRDPEMNVPMDDSIMLQGPVMDIQQKKDGTKNIEQWQRSVYNGAGFRKEYNVPESSVAKYEAIFGTVTKGTKSCLPGHELTSVDTNGNPTGLTSCDAYAYDYVSFADACSGQLVDYNACYAQARMVVDENYCYRRLSSVNNSEADNTKRDACVNYDTNPPNAHSNVYDSTKGGAWYAAGWSIDANGQYVFPVLKKLFSYAPANHSFSMGVQGDATTKTIRQQAITKRETPTTIVTDEAAVWKDTTNKNFVYNNNMDASGYEYVHSDPYAYNQIQIVPMSSEISGSVNQTVETQK